MTQLSTANEIISLLKKNGSMTILEIATTLRLTKADIRYQINNLLKSNVIVEEKPTNGTPGRPAKRYSLAPENFPDNYVYLVEAMLTWFPDKDSMIDGLSNYFSIINPDENSLSIISKLNSLKSFLDNMNYDTRWETHLQGPILFFSNCPYRKIIHSHPELCEMDQQIISKYLSQDVITQSTIEKGSRNCQFLIQIKSMYKTMSA